MPDERWGGMRRDLDAACLAVGRDPSTLERTVGVNVRIDELKGASDGDGDSEKRLSGSPEEIAAGIAAYAAEGTGQLIAALQPSTAEAVEHFAAAVRIARTQGAV
jgi:alkanesulfonate monooxygenase SsuD/methylene tetrahydromethanopterin reductase-like flavin-dependent oxidoreductase (luciferase family)